MTRQIPAQRQPLRYDAYGRPLRNRKKNGALRFLLGFLLPYLVINGILLFLVITKPTIRAEEPDTTDYQHAAIRFEIDSLLPMRSVKATLEGDPIELTKKGSVYSAELEANGNLTISVESLNRMTDVEHISINILDETAPSIEESSAVIGAGYVEFQVSDSQSGVNFDSIYATDSDGSHLKPTDIQRTSGKITFSMKGDSLNVYVQDLAGNQQTVNFSVS
ncbi:hypothetical protein HW273_10765 [Oribacterium sp. oral taxon 102]|uniref:hypothetical protein n=1 Tax=Oribacterium sp. oral taxon 102 TaxID=671214 RepID=UPI0015BB1836|nr:hypothetical protein [Oribacterium sp. oral taxon 102]NWO22364.1 hypothetical protein [Oribacterium sp. oral taxon 102]